MSLDKFRMAIFGDFTARAARGVMEIGPDLAKRRAIKLDVDDLDDIIESFATTLVLPIGKDGAGVEVQLNELDDLHPDELFENVAMFEELNGLKQQLGTGSMSAGVIEKLTSWGETFGTKVHVPKYSAADHVPADKALSDFQALIGGTGRAVSEPSPAADLIARVVGPHIVAAPDAGIDAMQAAVDEAISSAMRMILHHPDFQAVESIWRSVDMLARRIETDHTLEVVLYDVSAEEMAADLTQAEPGLRDLLDQEGFTALFGLYTFEETPPHADLLGRIARLAASVKAPFFTSLSPAYLEIKKEHRPEIVAQAWDGLRAMPEAGYLGIASPRFMLRRPYGAKSEPIYEFAFEEFTMSEGLKGLLWANPAVAVAILLAETYKKDGKSMALGTVMNLGDIPYHFITDAHGDQVSLPCTERNLTSGKMETTVMRGLMPVLSIKGRDEIRLGSFQSLAGEEIMGPWNGNEISSFSPPPAPIVRGLDIEMDLPISDDQDDLDALLDDLSEGDDADDDETSLDDLLASFSDEDDDDTSDNDIDAELAALLEDL